jgi:hypothetical protein
MEARRGGVGRMIDGTLRQDVEDEDAGASSSRTAMCAAPDVPWRRRLFVVVSVVVPAVDVCNEMATATPALR